VNPSQRQTRLDHGVTIEASVEGPDEASFERPLSGLDAVTVALAESAVARVKLGAHLAGCSDGDVIGQETVECPNHPVRWMSGRRAKMGDLTQGVGARVGPARRHWNDLLLKKGAETATEFPLHAAALLLHLPADKISPVVLQVEADGP